MKVKVTCHHHMHPHTQFHKHEYVYTKKENEVREERDGEGVTCVSFFKWSMIFLDMQHQYGLGAISKFNYICTLYLFHIKNQYQQKTDMNCGPNEDIEKEKKIKQQQ